MGALSGVVLDAKIWWIKQDGISVIKFEAAQLHFLSNILQPLPSLLLKLPIDYQIPSPAQGLETAEPGGPWHQTFAFGWLENL